MSLFDIISIAVREPKIFFIYIYIPASEADADAVNLNEIKTLSIDFQIN